MGLGCQIELLGVGRMRERELRCGALVELPDTPSRLGWYDAVATASAGPRVDDRLDALRQPGEWPRGEGRWARGPSRFAGVRRGESWQEVLEEELFDWVVGPTGDAHDARGAKVGTERARVDRRRHEYKLEVWGVGDPGS